MADSPSTGTPYVPEGTLDPAAGLNDAIEHLDGLVQASVLGIEDDPAVTPADGDQYIVGVGTGAWLGQDDNVARWVAEGAFWKFYEAGTEIREVLNLSDFSKLAFEGSGGWTVVGGLSDAPIDGVGYVRKDAAWVPESGGGGGTWGSITGTLSAQTDLQTALDAKLDDSQASAFGLTLIDDADATAARSTMGLGTAATTAATDYATAAQGTTADSAVQPGDAATVLNMATARLLGRSTAGSGAVEEITVGAGLTLSGGALTASGGGGSTQGKQSIYVAAGAMRPSVTGGCAALSAIASAASQPDIQSLNFDATTQEYAQFSVVMPKKWNEGTVTFIPHWSHAATTVNFGVVWSLQAVAVGNDDAIATAFGTAQTSTDTGGTTNDLYSGPESAAITVAGTPGSEEMVFFRVSRVTGDGSDTMAIDARLHGITLYVTTDADTDA